MHLTSRKITQNGEETTFKETIAENFQKLLNVTNSRAQKAQQMTNKKNKKKYAPIHIIALISRKDQKISSSKPVKKTYYLKVNNN